MSHAQSRVIHPGTPRQASPFTGKIPDRAREGRDLCSCRVAAGSRVLHRVFQNGGFNSGGFLSAGSSSSQEGGQDPSHPHSPTTHHHQPPARPCLGLEFRVRCCSDRKSQPPALPSTICNRHQQPVGRPQFHVEMRHDNHVSSSPPAGATSLAPKTARSVVLSPSPGR